MSTSLKWLRFLCLLAVLSAGQTTVRPTPKAQNTKPKAASRNASMGLTVVRYKVVQISTTEVDDILKGVNSLLRCGRSFSRKGSVETMPDQIAGGADFGGIIRNATQMDGVDALQWNVKVVVQIGICVGGDGKPAPGIYHGCVWKAKPVDSPSLVVDKQTTPDEQVIVWSHELGHTQRLTHRNDDKAVMNKDISPDHREISSQECTILGGER